MLADFDAFLLDLDNTLLKLDFEKFMEEYYQLLVRRVSAHVEPERFLAALDAGLAAMFTADGTRTNEEEFYRAFWQVLGEEKAELKEEFILFYREDFPKLARHANSVPYSSELVNFLRKQQKKVVLATNPVFPAVAIEQRLAWAGLSAEDFDLITSLENMSSCKPNPRYFLEICSRIGVEPVRALMVGDDAELDLAARHAGLAVVLIGEKAVEDVPVFPDFAAFARALLEGAGI